MQNQELLKQLESLKAELQEGQSLRPPFPFVSINYDEEVAPLGAFLIGGEKRNGEWLTPPTSVQRLDFVFLKERVQYTYYDQHVGRQTVKSTIMPRFQAKRAIDLISGKSIAELKQQGIDLTFNVLLLILVKLDNAFTPALFKLKGATLKSWIDYTKQNKDIAVSVILEAVTKKEKKGNVRFFTLNFSRRELTEEEARAVVTLTPPAVNAFEEWVFTYNNRHIEVNGNNGNGIEHAEEDIEIEL